MTPEARWSRTEQISRGGRRAHELAMLLAEALTRGRVGSGEVVSVDRALGKILPTRYWVAP